MSSRLTLVDSVAGPHVTGFSRQESLDDLRRRPAIMRRLNATEAGRIEKERPP
jgi:hypothetical protein